MLEKKGKKISRKLLIYAITCFMSVGYAVAEGISVTSVELNENKAAVVINDVVEIREIEVMDNDIEFPSYVSTSGREYPQVKFRTPRARQKVVDAILNNRPSPDRVKSINYNITDISSFDASGSSLAGFATVVINNEMEIDVRIMKARYSDDYWISWPARPPDPDRGEEGWQDLVIVTNRRARNIIEDDLKEAFSQYEPEKTDKIEIEVKEGRVDSPLTVSAVDVRRVERGDLVALADVDLNYSFRIKDVELYERRGHYFIEFPRDYDDTGRAYPKMQIFSRALRSEIRRAVEEGSPSVDKYREIGFEITRFERNIRESALKYRGGVTINGAVEFDFAILDGPNYDAFVSWPSVREDGEYVYKIFPINRQVREKIEDTILQRYHRQQ